MFVALALEMIKTDEGLCLLGSFLSRIASLDLVEQFRVFFQ